MPTATFQQGSTYTGTIDTTLYEAKPNTVSGDNGSLYVDAGTGVREQTVLDFTNLFGNGPGQIPVNATITSAVLELNVTNASDHGGTIYRMTSSWDESSTWNSMVGGVQLGTETASKADLTLAKVATGLQDFNVTASLQAWLSGATTADQANAANHGWLFNSTSTDAWVFNSSEGGVAPSLVVTYTVPNAPPPSQLALEGPVSMTEGTSDTPTSFTFTVDRTGDTSAAVSVDYSVTGSGAHPTDASDFSAGLFPTGTITFAAGQTTQTIVVDVAADSIVESDETFSLNLSNPTNGGQITGGTTTGTILNDDSPAQLVLEGPVSSNEGTSANPTSFVFTVDRTGDTSTAVSVNYGVTGNGSAPADASDFAGGVLPSGTINFAAGQTTQTIVINVAADSNVESNEGFLLSLSNATNGAVITGATATGTIVNDDMPTGPVTTSFQQGVNYTGTIDTTLQQAKPDANGSGFVNVHVDSGGGANEQGLLEFTNLFGSGPGQIPIGATITSAVLEVNVTNASSNGGTIYRMTSGWDGNSTWNSMGSGVQLGVETASTPDLSVGKVALGTHDFDVTSSLQAWLSGATTADVANAANKGWLFNTTSTDAWLFNSSEGAPAPILTVTYTLPGNQPPPTSQLALGGPVSQLEGTSDSPTSFVFTVNRTGDTSIAATVDFAVSGSGPNAATFSDFSSGVLPTGTVSFAAGETSKTITINVVGDTSTESDEGFSVTLSNATGGATIAGATTTGTILNDDSNANILGVNIINGSTYGNGNPNSPNHYGSTDPTDIAYNPVDHSFYLVDSEIDEKPFYGTVNMWHLDSQGHLLAPISLEGFTHEPTGVAVYVTPTGATHLFITDDNAQKIFEVDTANPTVALRSFSTTKFGAVDPEDISINPNNGNLFVMSENDHTIYEITQSGTLVTKTVLPDTFVPHADPNAADAGAEAVAYDPVKDVFWVSGGFNPDIFEISRSGQILNVINVLEQYPNPSLVGTAQGVYLKGLELAPSSDGSGHLSLWVTDYGRDQYPDGRVIEIMLSDMAPGASGTSSATTGATTMAQQNLDLATGQLTHPIAHAHEQLADFRASEHALPSLAMASAEWFGGHHSDYLL